MSHKRKAIEPEEELFLLLSRANHLVRKDAEKITANSRITVAEYNLLRIIENNPKIMAKEARQKLFATAPSVTQLVQSLESKGLITRKTDVEDARKQHLILTDSGLDLTKIIKKQIKTLVSALKIPSLVLNNSVESLAKLLSYFSSPVSNVR